MRLARSAANGHAAQREPEAAALRAAPRVEHAAGAALEDAELGPGPQQQREPGSVGAPIFRRTAAFS